MPAVGKGNISSKIISATADGFSTGLSPLKQIVSNEKLTLAEQLEERLKQALPPSGMKVTCRGHAFSETQTHVEDAPVRT